MVSHTPAIFGGHRYYGSGEMVLVCHVISHHSTKFGGANIMGLVSQMISQKHVIKGPCDFMGRSPSR